MEKKTKEEILDEMKIVKYRDLFIRAMTVFADQEVAEAKAEILNVGLPKSADECMTRGEFARKWFDKIDHRELLDQLYADLTKVCAYSVNKVGCELETKDTEIKEWKVEATKRHEEVDRQDETIKRLTSRVKELEESKQDLAREMDNQLQEPQRIITAYKQRLIEALHNKWPFFDRRIEQLINETL